jgi:hypothetical protein
MTSAATEAPPGPRVLPFATSVVLPIAFLVAVLHCVAITLSDGYWFDEVYMLAIGRFHLEWGSADQPPLTPALAALMDRLAPGSHLMLALPSVLATACSIVLAGLIAREMGGDRRAQGMTAAAQATGAWATFSGHWLTPYALEPVQWLTVLWLVIRWVRTREDRLLLVAGVVVGIAAMTKFQVLLLSAAVLLAIAAVGPRDLLRRPMLWVGGAVAVVIALPTVLWQSARGWPQLQMTSVVAGEAEALYGGRPGIAVQLLLFAGVIGVALGGYGAWHVLRDRTLRDYRFVAVTFAVLYLLFVATAGRPYYLAGLYAPLAAAGALGFQRRREAGHGRRWVLWPVLALSVALAAGSLILSASVTRSDVGEQIAKRTAETYQELPAAQRERTVIVGESYIIAAYLDGYSQRYRIPETFSLNRSYGYFPAPAAERDSVLFIGRDPARLGAYFATSNEVAAIGDDMHAYLLTGRRQPWDVLWRNERTLVVT